MVRVVAATAQSSVAVAVLFFLLCWCQTHDLAAAQTPIPARYDGFVYGRGGGGGSSPSPVLRFDDSVLVEAFFDPLCPDSKEAWPHLKRAIHHYGHHRISLIVHPFPLPYHSNAFLASRALHIANKLNVSSTYPLLELFFKYQEKYYNAATINVSRASIIDDMTKLSVKAVGGKSSSFKAGYNDTKTDSAARISFKYSCSRGIAGTPSFLVNGIPIPESESTVDYKMWRRIIDPLFLKQ